jgi:hypothetical protein
MPSADQSYTERIITGIMGVTHLVRGSEVETGIRNNLARYSTSLLETLASELSVPSEHSARIVQEICRGTVERKILCALHVYDRVDGLTYDQAADYFWSLCKYQHPSVPIAPYSAETTLPEHLALIKVTHAVTTHLRLHPNGRTMDKTTPTTPVGKPGGIERLNQPDMIEFVLARHHDADLIATVVSTLGIMDADGMNTIFSLVDSRPDGREKLSAILASGNVTRMVQIEELFKGTTITALAEGIL